MLSGQRILAGSDSHRTADPSNIRDGFYLSREFENCSPRTIQTYKQRLGWFCDFLERRYPETRLDTVDYKHIMAYILSLRERKLRPATIKSQYIALRAFYKWAIEQGFIDEKAYPLRSLKPPKVPKIIKGFLAPAQRDQLLQLCPPNRLLGARNAAIIWLFWTSSMRLSELANLQLADLEWTGERIKVLGKGAKERYVPFTKEAKKAVWRYLQYRKDSLPCLWLNEEGQPLKRQGVVKTMQNLFADAGIKVKDVCHIFRRTWAWESIKAGVNLEFVRIVGGWESLETLQVYVRAISVEQALEGIKKGRVGRG